MLKRLQALRSAATPALSLFFIVAGLLSVVAVRTQERQLGYEVLALHREHRLAVEEKKRRSVELAKLTRPQRVESVAQQKLDFKKLQKNQIIMLSNRGLN